MPFRFFQVFQILLLIAILVISFTAQPLHSRQEDPLLALLATLSKE